MQTPIHTGIIGFGLSGRVFHAPFVHSHPGFSLKSVVERHQRHSAGIYPEVEVVRDIDDLLKDKSLELMVITTPNTLHYPMAEACLEAGKHVVIEKPFVPRSAEADALISLAGRRGKKIFVYQNRRWDGDFLTIRKLMQQNRLGDIEYYEARFDRFSPELKPGAWRDENIPGGGILYDLGAHLIDQALCLFGMPQSVKAELKAERPGSPVDDFFRLEMQYAGLEVVLTAGMMVTEAVPRFTVKGSKGTYTKYGIDPQEGALKKGEMPVGEDWGTEDRLFHGKLGPESIPTEKGNYMAFYDNVYEVIRENKTEAIAPVEARNVIFIIEKAIESNASGKKIEIRQR